MRPQDLNCYDDPEDEQVEPVETDDDADELNPWSWLDGCRPFGEDPYDGVKFWDG